MFPLSHTSIIASNTPHSNQFQQGDGTSSWYSLFGPAPFSCAAVSDPTTDNCLTKSSQANAGNNMEKDTDGLSLIEEQNESCTFGPDLLFWPSGLPSTAARLPPPRSRQGSWAEHIWDPSPTDPVPTAFAENGSVRRPSSVFSQYSSPLITPSSSFHDRDWSAFSGWHETPQTNLELQSTASMWKPDVSQASFKDTSSGFWRSSFNDTTGARGASVDYLTSLISGHLEDTTGEPDGRRYSAPPCLSRPKTKKAPVEQVEDVVWTDIGRGTLFSEIKDATFFKVELRPGKSEVYFMYASNVEPKMSDHVIIEADRGFDLGIVVSTQVDVKRFARDGDYRMKRLIRLATPQEIEELSEKQKKEEEALAYCQELVETLELPMTVTMAVYQWDQRKLTFYYQSNERVDFRELVSGLFKTYKTRIWMCSEKTLR